MGEWSIMTLNSHPIPSFPIFSTRKTTTYWFSSSFSFFSVSKDRYKTWHTHTFMKEKNKTASSSTNRIQQYHVKHYVERNNSSLGKAQDWLRIEVYACDGINYALKSNGGSAIQSSTMGDGEPPGWEILVMFLLFLGGKHICGLFPLPKMGRGATKQHSTFWGTMIC